MSTPRSAVRSGGDPLTAWTTQVPATERDAILRVVDAFGIDFYGPDPMPDVDSLHARHATG
jgi:hypothetical protein